MVKNNMEDTLMNVSKRSFYNVFTLLRENLEESTIPYRIMLLMQEI